MRYTEVVGLRLNELLKAHHLSQTQFAKQSNISRTTINQTINGKARVVTFETLIVFCTTLNITLYDFFTSALFDKDIELYKKKNGRRITTL